MGDFFTTPPNTDIPVPPPADQFDVPPANFRTIGQQLGAGLRDAGATVQSTAGQVSFWNNPGTWLLTQLALVLAWFLSKTLCFVAFVMRVITSVDDAAAPGMDAVIRSSLEHVFQIPVGGTGPRKVASGLSGDAVGSQIGQAILASLTSGVQQSAGQPLQPNDTASAKFLGQLARMGVEGWADGFIAEAIGGEHLASVLELVPIMSDVLGLGRLSRRVLAPPLKILIEDPYTWKLNADYRPTLLAHDQATRQYLRGRMTRDDLDVQLGRQGFSATAIEALININSHFIGVGDASFLDTHGIWTHDAAVQELRDQGIDASRAETMLQMEQLRKIQVYREQLVADSTAAFAAGEIDEATLEENIRGAGVPDFEVSWIRQVAATRRLLTPKHLSRADVESCIKAGIMNIDDLRAWMTRENYPDDEQTFLELLLLGEIQNKADAQAKKDAAAKAKQQAAADKLAKQQAAAAAAQAAAPVKGITIAQYEKLVKDGQRTFDEYRAFLTDKGVGADAIAALVDLLHSSIDQATAAQKQHDAIAAAADVKHIPLATTEKAVQAGVLTIDDLRRLMVSNGFADADIATVIALNQAQLDAKKAAADAKAAAQASAADKSISLPELERAARLGLTSPANYAAALDAAGFDANSRDLMVGILNAQIATDQAARDTRKQAIAAASKKSISITSLEQAVIAGIRPIDDYRAQLTQLGFDAGDVDTMTALLQLRVDHAQTVADKKGQAAAQLGTKQISLAALERAVKLGVIGVDAYTAHLADIGFSPDDQAILTTSLLADIANAAAANTRRNAIAKKLGVKGISLAQEEQLVRDGISTLDAYQSFLVAQGFSADDAANLRQLLADQIAQAADAKAAHDLAQQRAATRTISLAKEEQAVIDGIRTMDDYAALLQSLGFDDLDQATLIDLLASKIGAARAKAAGAGSSSSPGTPAAA